ncbi:MAG TPA: hypothetical protein EYH58_06525 [Aquifex aeolicus]|nr:hypothetical protein [Aquifex aeolicus]
MSERIVPLSKEGSSNRRSFDVLEFLGKLEWLRDAELENAKPFDTTKLRTPHIFFVMFQGARYAVSFHGTALLMGILIMVFTFISEIFFYLSILVEIFLIFVKIGFPLYVIRNFVIWENSLMTKLVENFVLGFAITSLTIDILSAIFSFFAYVFFKILSVYPQFENISQVGFMFFNIKTAIVWFVNSLCDVIPIIYFYLYKKGKKFNVPRWTPLDEIPE